MSAPPTAIANDGTIFVAESGTGGSNCVDVGEGDEAFTTCIGKTSSITQIRNGHQRRVVRGLMSNAGEDGFAAAGAQDVAVTKSRRLIFPIGWGNPLDSSPTHSTTTWRFSARSRPPMSAKTRPWPASRPASNGTTTLTASQPSGVAVRATLTASHGTGGTV